MATTIADSSPCKGEDEERVGSSVWYAFFSESDKREYYYNPYTRMSTWILPDGARCHVSKEGNFIETNPGFTPARNSFRTKPTLPGDDSGSSVGSLEYFKSKIFVVFKVVTAMAVLYMLSSRLLHQSNTTKLEEAQIPVNGSSTSPDDLLQVCDALIDFGVKFTEPCLAPSAEKEIRLKKALSAIQKLKRKEQKEKQKQRKQQQDQATNIGPGDEANHRTKAILDEQIQNVNNLIRNIENALRTGEDLLHRIVADAWSAGMPLDHEPGSPMEQVGACKAPFSYIFDPECRKLNATYDAEKFANVIVD